MGLPGNPESGQNILMEPKMFHTYVHTYSNPYLGLYTCTYSMRVLNLMVIFSAGQAHEVLRTRTGNMQLFSAVFLPLVTHKPRFEGLPYKVSTPTQENTKCVHQRKGICLGELTS